MKALSSRGLARMWLLTAGLLVPAGASAAIGMPGALNLSLTVSGQNLVFSFPTTSTNYYGLLTCSNLSQPWANLQSGIPGNGSLQSLAMPLPPASAQGFYRLELQPQPAGLILSQGDAFTILGHSCGGIQEQAYATGFSPATGYPTGAVYLKTSCGGSGRGGGYTTTTYTAWAAVTWDFAGNVITFSALPNAPAVDGAFTATDAYGDILYNNHGLAYLIVPVPGAPAGVTVAQAGDQFLVAWTPSGINPLAVTSSTLTATPVNSPSATLVTTVTNSAANGAIPLLQPQTTYQVTVANNALSGSGPASVPITLTTAAATIAPLAPTNVLASWSNLNPTGTTDTLVAQWSPADPGNSPIDQYLITITGSDGGGTFINSVSGGTLTTYFSVDYIPNWTVQVKAHNAAGWGSASAPVTLGGL